MGDKFMDPEVVQGGEFSKKEPYRILELRKNGGGGERGLWDSYFSEWTNRNCLKSV